MSERAERIGRNEALFREVNEQVDDLNRSLSSLGDETMHIVCECGDLGCVDGLVVPLRVYERVRADASIFFVQPGHELPDVEEVVEEHAGYHVVRKHPGQPERIAVESDPRA
jgi:hypothetical protein